MIILRHGGPALVLGDCLAPTLVLTPDAAPCPVCGQHATEAGDGRGGHMQAQLVDGIAYGRGVLEPCGHEIGAITIDVVVAGTEAVAS